jgi:hypothetical protein
MLQSTINGLFGCTLLSGPLYSTEIEVEAGSELPSRTTKHWVAKPEGSLRGYAIEYVSTEPKSLAEAGAAVVNLYQRLQTANCQIRDSMRASVHVHLNMSDQPVQQVITFLSLYWIFEEILVRVYCGEERSGNLFCLRIVDTDFPVLALRDMIVSNRPSKISFDPLKYSACNVGALRRYGTLEFRTLRTPTSPEPILEWLQVIDQLRQSAARFDSPAQVLEQFSGGGGEQLARVVFSDSQFEKLSQEPIEEAAYRAARIIQPLVYSTTWRA